MHEGDHSCRAAPVGLRAAHHSFDPRQQPRLQFPARLQAPWETGDPMGCPPHFPRPAWALIGGRSTPGFLGTSHPPANLDADRISVRSHDVFVCHSFTHPAHPRLIPPRPVRRPTDPADPGDTRHPGPHEFAVWFIFPWAFSGRGLPADRDPLACLRFWSKRSGSLPRVQAEPTPGSDPDGPSMGPVRGGTGPTLPSKAARTDPGTAKLPRR
jgi:hypothetical protein